MAEDNGGSVNTDDTSSKESVIKNAAPTTSSTQPTPNTVSYGIINSTDSNLTSTVPSKNGSREKIYLSAAAVLALIILGIAGFLQLHKSKATPAATTYKVAQSSVVGSPPLTTGATKMVWQLGSQLIVSNLNGTNQKVIFKNLLDDNQGVGGKSAEVSPDGKYVAIVAEGDSNNNDQPFYLQNLQSGKQAEISNQSIQSYAWSPNSNDIAYEYGGDNDGLNTAGECSVEASCDNTVSLYSLSSSKSTNLNGLAMPVSQGDNIDQFVNNDNFTFDVEGSNIPGVLYDLVAHNTTNINNAYVSGTNPGNPGLAFTSAGGLIISPDYSKILFELSYSSDQSQSPCQIYSVNTANAVVGNLLFTAPSVCNSDFAWNGDNQIYYSRTATDGSTPSIYEYDLTTKKTSLILAGTPQVSYEVAGVIDGTGLLVFSTSDVTSDTNFVTTIQERSLTGTNPVTITTLSPGTESSDFQFDGATN